MQLDYETDVDIDITIEILTEVSEVLGLGEEVTTRSS